MRCALVLRKTAHLLVVTAVAAAFCGSATAEETAQPGAVSFDSPLPMPEQVTKADAPQGEAEPAQAATLLAEQRAPTLMEPMSAHLPVETPGQPTPAVRPATPAVSPPAEEAAEADWPTPAKVDEEAPLAIGSGEPAPLAAVPADAAPVQAVATDESAAMASESEAGAEAAPDPSAAEPLRPVSDPMHSGPVPVEVASFSGVTPGVTTAEEIEKAWGAPKEIRKQGKSLVHLYSVPPFDWVEVSIFKNVATAVIIRFDKPFPVGAVAKQLELSHIRPVLVSNELGGILGQVYPERGVLFAFEPSEEAGKASMQVTQIILEPISAEPFVLRAETTLKTLGDLSRQDLERAIELDNTNARAYWLLARVQTTSGELEKALRSAAKAVQIEPSNARYRVTGAQILGQLGQLTEAMQEARKAIETAENRPHVKARAICLLGDLLASGARPDYRQAIQQHIEAVNVAGPYATDRHPAIRVAAKEVLVDAHLGAAHDIAWGDWKEKQKAVTKWLSRADAFARDLVATEGASLEHQFRVNTRALAACVGTGGELDPTEWTEGAVATGDELIGKTDDPDRQVHYQRDLGMALYDAMQICQMRNDHAAALKHGQRAVELLELSGAAQQSETAAYMLGRLYFRLGAIHAIRDNDHEGAVAWFDKAVPLLSKQTPQDAFADLGRHGETFVSMGVSYWESGQREKAVELTKDGVALMKQAVGQGTLAEAALQVPYDNLASMYRQLGRTDDARQFEAMAGRGQSPKIR